VLDLVTLKWRHANAEVEGVENVRCPRIAGHTLDGGRDPYKRLT